MIYNWKPNKATKMPPWLILFKISIKKITELAKKDSILDEFLNSLSNAANNSKMIFATN